MELLKGLRPIKRPLLRRATLNQPRAYDLQTKVLRKLIEQARGTVFGKEYNFKRLVFSDNIVHDFSEEVKIHTYLDIQPYWHRAYNGEESVTWPGKVQYFALSSGTSDGPSKFIPVTATMLKALRNASLRQMLAIARSGVPADYLTKDNLIITGSTDLFYNGVSYSGDLSGIAALNSPFYLQLITKPERETLKKRVWDEKLEEITENAHKWDVGMVVGVPAWVQILFEKIIARYNLKTMHDLWPNLSIYVHGGVTFEPFKRAFDHLLARPLYCFETYLASEGFVAYQSRMEAEGMKMLLKNGVFYEFIPFNQDNFTDEGELKPNAKALNILQVEADKEYALIMSTCSGAWRYLIGDVIKFTSLDHMEIIITGRTKHFLSLCGEHLSVDNMNRAIKLTSDEMNISVKEFTVAGVPYQGMFAHHWYIGCDESFNTEEFNKRLDGHLKSLNDDYKTEREHALRNVLVEAVPTHWFIEFLKEQGRGGAQTKFPRVLRKTRYDDWYEFLRRKRGTQAAGH